MSLRGRAVLVAEGQSGKGEDSEMEGGFSHEGGRVCKMGSITWTKARWVRILAASPLRRVPSSGQVKDLLLGPLQCLMHLGSSFVPPLLLSM